MLTTYDSLHQMGHPIYIQNFPNTFNTMDENLDNLS